MTVELLTLLLTAILAASLWIPFIIGVNMLPAPADGRDIFLVPRDPLSLPPWIARAYRAHQNCLEQAMPFSIIVIIAHLVGVSSTATQLSCIAFLLLRVLHAIGMISGIARFPLRPIIFTAGYIAILVLAAQIVF